MTARRHTSNGTGQSTARPRKVVAGERARPVVWVPVVKNYGAKASYSTTAYERRRDERKGLVS